MRKLILVVALCSFGFLGQTYAWGDADECITSCATSINADSGNSAETCGGYMSSCHCSTIASNYGGCWRPHGVFSSCPSGWSAIAQTVTNKYCCSDLTQPCWLQREGSEAANTETIESTEQADLKRILDSETISSAFYGVVNLVNRSPNAGRANALNARLDACLGYSNVDAFTDYRSCETACGDGSKNGYCQNSSGAVCIDRCQCKYPGNGDCDGL